MFYIEFEIHFFVLKQAHLMIFFSKLYHQKGQEQVYAKFGGDSTSSVAANPDNHTWTRGKKGG